MESYSATVNSPAALQRGEGCGIRLHSQKVLPPSLNTWPSPGDTVKMKEGTPRAGSEVLGNIKQAALLQLPSPATLL